MARKGVQMTKRNKHLKRNLMYTVLVVVSGRYFGCITKKPPQGLQLNLQKGTWSYDGESFPIGQCCQIRDFPKGEGEVMLGVYDETQWDHVGHAFKDSDAYLRGHRQKV